MNANQRILAIATILSVSVIGLKTNATTTTQATPQKGGEYLIAQLKCPRALVNDPTGTPLNVRDKPNGKQVIGRYQNGAGVRIVQYSKDKKWVLVSPDSREDKTPKGWVFAANLTCPEGSI
jgi:archaellum component FlaG (FlaF/FlaG flagellin family)